MVLMGDAGGRSLAQWRAYHGQPGPYSLGPDSLGPAEGAARGTVQAHHMADCGVYPSTSHDWWSYTPACYEAGTPVPVRLD
jgi:hypothetical protein